MRHCAIAPMLLLINSLPDCEGSELLCFTRDLNKVPTEAGGEMKE